MKESNTTYAYFIEQMVKPSFKKVRELSCDFVHKLSKKQIDELHESLHYGIDLLDSEPLMQMYIYSYGQMHFEKLSYAFSNLSKDIKTANMVDIVDYGCGQGLASLCYHDFTSKNYLQQKVESITLIEPSKHALSRAELLCNKFFPNTKIVAVNKAFDELSTSDIPINSNIPTLHFFSNVLDLESFDIDSLAKTIKSSCYGYNEFVIVSPMQNIDKVKRLQEFVNIIDGNLYFEEYYDKQEFRENKDWTCSVILCNTNLKYKTYKEKLYSTPYAYQKEHPIITGTKFKLCKSEADSCEVIVRDAKIDNSSTILNAIITQYLPNKKKKTKEVIIDYTVCHLVRPGNYLDPTKLIFFERNNYTGERLRVAFHKDAILEDKIHFPVLEGLGGWKETARQKFLTNSDLRTVKKIMVEERHNKETGETFLAMCFLCNDNKKRSHYLSKFSNLTAGEEVDPKSVEVIEFDNGVDEPIYRLDGMPIKTP